MQVHFVRYNPETLEVIASGHMEEKHIDMLNSRGEHYMKIKDAIQPGINYKVDLANKTLLTFSKGPDYEATFNEVKRLIISQLAKSDYTQAADADDHFTKEEQLAWRNYRKAIRNAQNAVDLQTLLETLPATNPKGIDPFASYRHILTLDIPE